MRGTRIGGGRQRWLAGPGNGREGPSCIVDGRRFLTSHQQADCRVREKNLAGCIYNTGF